MTDAPENVAPVARAGGMGQDTWLAAILSVADIRVAVPAALVEKSLASPATLGPALPGERAMLGTIAEADAIYPLIDLAPCLGLGSGSATNGTVVLLRAGAQRIALAVDRVEGVRELRRDAVVRMSTCQHVSTFAMTRLDESGPPVIVLEEQDFACIDGFVLAKAPDATSGHANRGPRPRAAGHLRSYLSFTRDGATYGVDVAQVSEIIVGPKPAAMALPLGNFLGTIVSRGEDVVLIDRPLPGCGAPPPTAAPSHAIVLQAEGLRFAVPADAIHALLKLGSDAITALPGTGSMRHRVAGLASASVGTRPQIMIDAAAVLSTPGIRSLVEQHRCAEADASQQHASGPFHRYLELEAGGIFHVRLEHVRELAMLPRDAIVLDQAESTIDGYAHHRGQTISVIDLPSRFGSATVRTTTEKLVIVATKDGDVGFIVDAFKAIKHVRITEHSTREADTRGGSAYGRYWRFVDAIDKVGAAETCVFPLLDLIGIADNVFSASTE
ncbi:chemotaxis protein CheW [uncultured Jannaschia sp.]|uniref:chemotaxis protein CheW n=1 Tax=uncultured Jannaschia sp. TaxID=293347 RepID=UPI0026136B1E|nr:chemotaxis protein CheW [uncultured Jannaschia sp.]